MVVVVVNDDDALSCVHKSTRRTWSIGAHCFHSILHYDCSLVGAEKRT